MSVSGLFLILFLLFHLSMNVAAVFSGEAYNTICGLLGANWYAVAATLVLAAGFVIHIIYALMLTMQNKKARGNDSYAINSRPKGCRVVIAEHACSGRSSSPVLGASL